MAQSPKEFGDRLSKPFRQFIDDPLGSSKQILESGHGVPDTSTVTSYALRLHARVGNRRAVIGAVHEIALDQSRQVDEEYEVNALGTGLPRELTPQNVSTRTLTLRRYDLYAQTIEQLFGSPELLTLADQLGPLSMRLSWQSPQAGSLSASLLNQPTARTRVYEFVDCYITTLGRTVSTDNVIVGANASMVWRTIRRLA